MSHTQPWRPDLTPDQPLTSLLGQLRALIQDAWARVLRGADAIQLQTCWQVGRHLVEFEQGGAARNLWQMRLLYQSFPIRDALRHELSWTNYRTVLPSEEKLRRELDRERQTLTERRSHSLKTSGRNRP
jgi:hypothetical protein